MAGKRKQPGAVGAASGPGRGNNFEQQYNAPPAHSVQLKSADCSYVKRYIFPLSSDPSVGKLWFDPIGRGRFSQEIFDHFDRLAEPSPADSNVVFFRPRTSMLAIQYSCGDWSIIWISPSGERAKVRVGVPTLEDAWSLALSCGLPVVGQRPQR